MDHATPVCADDVMQLQQLNRGERPTSRHLVTLGDIDRENGASDRRQEADRAGRLGDLVRFGGLGLHLLVMVEQGKRVPAVLDPRARHSHPPTAKPRDQPDRRPARRSADAGY